MTLGQNFLLNIRNLANIMELGRGLKELRFDRSWATNYLCAKIYGQMKSTQEKSHSETQLDRKFSSQLYARGF